MDNQEAQNISGEWKLDINFMFQNIDVKLLLSQDGDLVSGSVSSSFGDGLIENGKVSGNTFVASAKISMQGRDARLEIKGVVEGATMKGKIESPLVPMALNFEGKRA